jgi:hypothetical protein
LSTETKNIDYGGSSLVSQISGVSRQTLTGDVKELIEPEKEPMVPGRNRKPGGSRKQVWETQAGILEALSGLVAAHTKGAPMKLLLWTNKSLRNLETGLSELRFKVCYRIIGEMLLKLGYGLQGDKKTLTVAHRLNISMMKRKERLRKVIRLF